MKRWASCFVAVSVLAVLIIGPQAATAQQLAAHSPLNDKQVLGMRLFNQSCRVCHTHPHLGSPMYGPPLSSQSLSGDEDSMRQVISNGTPRMPGFKHHFEPAQIDSIVAYLKTIPAPQP